MQEGRRNVLACIPAQRFHRSVRSLLRAVTMMPLWRGSRRKDGTWRLDWPQPGLSPSGGGPWASFGCGVRMWTGRVVSPGRSSRTDKVRSIKKRLPRRPGGITSAGWTDKTEVDSGADGKQVRFLGDTAVYKTGQARAPAAPASCPQPSRKTLTKSARKKRIADTISRPAWRPAGPAKQIAKQTMGGYLKRPGCALAGLLQALRNRRRVIMPPRSLATGKPKLAADALHKGEPFPVAPAQTL